MVGDAIGAIAAIESGARTTRARRRISAIPRAAGGPTTGSTATVRLLTDPGSGAGAIIQSSRAEGVVRGSLDGLLYLEAVDADVVVNVDDLVVTSGLGGSYTRGLLIEMDKYYQTVFREGWNYGKHRGKRTKAA